VQNELIIIHMVMNLTELFAQSDRQIEQTDLGFKRYLFAKLPWQDRLIGIKGARGVGKTTLLLQKLKSLKVSSPQVVYLQLDDLHFSSYTLFDTASEIIKLGGRKFFLDEVHKYPGWAREVKLIYDRHPGVHVVFTGSSVIDISKEEAELGRRAALYDMPGLSYREYLNLAYGQGLETVSLETILSESGGNFRSLFPSDFAPLKYFGEYLEFGYYPFFAEYRETFHLRLRQMVRFIVEHDMSEIKEFDLRNAKKMLQLIAIIAAQVPFKPNYSKLAEKTGLHRNSLASYMQYLERAQIVNLLYPKAFSTAALQKPEKIYFNNTNLMYALAESKPETGALRETFTYNQVAIGHSIRQGKIGDFLINDKWVFEVGGISKSRKQLTGRENEFLVIDNLEYPVTNRIPLWTLGFLY